MCFIGIFVFFCVVTNHVLKTHNFTMCQYTTLYILNSYTSVCIVQQEDECGIFLMSCQPSCTFVTLSFSKQVRYLYTESKSDTFPYIQARLFHTHFIKFHFILFCWLSLIQMLHFMTMRFQINESMSKKDGGHKNKFNTCPQNGAVK